MKEEILSKTISVLLSSSMFPAVLDGCENNVEDRWIVVQTVERYLFIPFHLPFFHPSFLFSHTYILSSLDTHGPDSCTLLPGLQRL